MSLRVGDDEVGSPKCAAIDRLERAGGRRARPEAAPIRDERVRPPDERGEDDWAVSSGVPGCREIEMAGVADQEDIEVSSGATKEPELGGHEPRKRAGACPPT